MRLIVCVAWHGVCGVLCGIASAAYYVACCICYVCVACHIVGCVVCVMCVVSVVFCVVCIMCRVLYIHCLLYDVYAVCTCVAVCWHACV